MNACEHGFKSGLYGEDPRACPFEKMTREWHEWQRWHGYGVDLVATLRPTPDAAEE